jgi:hypothetical protein
MKKLLLLSLLFYSLIASSQTESDIIGSWQFYTLKKPTSDRTELYKAAMTLLGTMELQLNPDKTYIKSFRGTPETGQWELRGKEIFFTPPTGKNSSYTIAALENNLLTVNMNTISVMLSKVGADVPPPPSK